MLVKIPDDTPIELRLDELNSEDICQYENKNEIPDELYEYLFSYVSSNASGKGLVIVVSEPIETLADKIETNTYESDYDPDDEEAENVRSVQCIFKCRFSYFMAGIKRRIIKINRLKVIKMCLRNSPERVEIIPPLR